MEDKSQCTLHNNPNFKLVAPGCQPSLSAEPPCCPCEPAAMDARDCDARVWVATLVVRFASPCLCEPAMGARASYFPLSINTLLIYCLHRQEWHCNRWNIGNRMDIGGVGREEGGGASLFGLWGEPFWVLLLRLEELLNEWLKPLRTLARRSGFYKNHYLHFWRTICWKRLFFDPFRVSETLIRDRLRFLKNLLLVLWYLLRFF